MAQIEVQPPRFSVREISKRFGGVQALSNVSLDVERGSVHGLLGENGAGKSTLVKILTGSVRPDSGSIFVGGEEVQIATPRAARQLGIGAVHQELNLFPDLTVLSNVFAGIEVHDRLGFLQREHMVQDLRKSMDAVGWLIEPDRLVASLSLAERQMVEILKAFHLGADLILLDEPNSALTEEETQALFGLMRRFQDQHQSFLLVSHRLDEVFEMADHITILRDGRVVASAPRSELSLREAVRLMVGADQAAAIRAQSAAVHTGPPRLAASDLTTDRFSDVTFDVRPGEIVGFAGLEGAGVQALFRTVFGLRKVRSGRMELDGEPFAPRHPWGAVARGVASIPADRHNDGLFMDRTVGENIVLVILRRVMSALGFVRKRRIEETAERYATAFRVRTPSLHSRVVQLSGGNQQKVVLAKWLATSPKVLVLNDPGRGIDVGAKREVHDAIRKLAAQGMAILMWSSEADELLQLCDRILVMRKGRLIREFLPSRTSRQELLLSMSAEAEG
jgi:ABC-type sugar transport system ATPase subunit